MSIASEIQRISGCREDIKNAIAAKGVTVPATATLSSCPDLIGSIQTGGGGGGSYMFDTSVIAPFTGYKTASFTATQIPVSAGDWNDVSITYETSSTGTRLISATYMIPVSSLICADTIPISSLLHFEFDSIPYILRFNKLATRSYKNTTLSMSMYDDFQKNGNTGEGILTTAIWNDLRNSIINRFGNFNNWISSDSATDMCYIDFNIYTYDNSLNTVVPTSMDVSNMQYNITGTAYPYPERPTTITGNTSATCSGYCNLNTAEPKESYPDLLNLAQYVYASASIDMSNGNTSAIPTLRNDSYSIYFYNGRCNLPYQTVTNYLPIVTWNLDSVVPDSAYSVSYSDENWNYSTTGYVYSSNLS